MSSQYKVVCGCECCISDKIINSAFISWRDRYLKKLKDQSQNAQIRRSGRKAHHIYETYKNTVMPHGHHIYSKAYDMAQSTLCAYPQCDHSLPDWKCVLRCCSNFPCINISDQETDNHNPDTTPSIRFYIYHIFAHFTTHVGIPLKEKKYVTFLNKNLHHMNQQKYTPENI